MEGRGQRDATSRAGGGRTRGRKTRLAAELARAVDSEGDLVLLGRCDDGLGEPFVEALAHVVAHAPADELATMLGPGAGELSRLVPELEQRLPGAAANDERSRDRAVPAVRCDRGLA